jgi:hypothetical protein
MPSSQLRRLLWTGLSSFEECSVEIFTYRFSSVVSGVLLDRCYLVLKVRREVWPRWITAGLSIIREVKRRKCVSRYEIIPRTTLPRLRAIGHILGNDAPPTISAKLSLYRCSKRSKRIVPLCRRMGNFIGSSLAFRF